MAASFGAGEDDSSLVAMQPSGLALAIYNGDVIPGDAAPLRRRPFACAAALTGAIA
jgi:hypothetical protein